MPDDVKTLKTGLTESKLVAGPLRPGISLVEDLLSEEKRKRVFEFLNQGGWQFGWKSNAQTDHFSFWHKHFAGSRHPDHYAKDGKKEVQYECSEELQRKAPLLHELWLNLQARALPNHMLVRCYANGTPFGTEGSIHTDSLSNRSFTCVYYPHDNWDPNWGGETVFFNREKTDIVASIYPRPNRMLMFDGTLPHVARGVSRICPVMRITLMFKTEMTDR